jgi:hypothetical protein
LPFLIENDEYSRVLLLRSRYGNRPSWGYAAAEFLPQSAEDHNSSSLQYRAFSQNFLKNFEPEIWYVSSFGGFFDFFSNNLITRSSSNASKTNS